MGFSRKEYWSGEPCPPPGDLPDPGIEPRSPALQVDSLPSEPPGKAGHLLQLGYISSFSCSNLYKTWLLDTIHFCGFALSVVYNLQIITLIMLVVQISSNQLIISSDFCSKRKSWFSNAATTYWFFLAPPLPKFDLSSPNRLGAVQSTLPSSHLQPTWVASPLLILCSTKS